MELVKKEQLGTCSTRLGVGRLAGWKEGQKWSSHGNPPCAKRCAALRMICLLHRKYILVSIALQVKYHI